MLSEALSTLKGPLVYILDSSECEYLDLQVEPSPSQLAVESRKGRDGLGQILRVYMASKESLLTSLHFCLPFFSVY
jgi:hypothetical protein